MVRYEQRDEKRNTMKSIVQKVNTKSTTQKEKKISKLNFVSWHKKSHGIGHNSLVRKMRHLQNYVIL